MELMQKFTYIKTFSQADLARDTMLSLTQASSRRMQRIERAGSRRKLKVSLRLFRVQFEGFKVSGLRVRVFHGCRAYARCGCHFLEPEVATAWLVLVHRGLSSFSGGHGSIQGMPLSVVQFARAPPSPFLQPQGTATEQQD